MSIRLAYLLIMTSLLSHYAYAEPTIAIIIDDMGNKYQRGDHMLQLPGEITYSFLPRTPFAQKLANLAHTRGKEVMLHMPMQPYSNLKLGPGGLTLNLDQQTFIQRLEENLNSVPYIVGVNNHMGSRLTQDKNAMNLVMKSIKHRKNLYFVDSRTTRESVAQLSAKEHNIPTARRDIFLDNDENVQAIRQQFQKLIRRAKKRGHATAIGHPYKETLQVLREELAKLPARQIQLISMSKMIALQQRNSSWQKPSSPLLKVAKNSKPSP